MNTEKFERKLSAILSADVKGYSRLMRDDEDETIRTITVYRSAIANLVEQYRGRVVDSPGDNILSEFGSGVDAVNCAVEVQRELAERNAELPENRRMVFRIGVNSGDVVQEGERIYGDGINIASRIEGLAEGGGICVSGTVYDSIEGKLGLEFEYLGEHAVKNIDKPIRVYRILSYPGAAAHRVVKAKRAVGRSWRNVLLAIAVVLILGGGALAIWHFYLRPSPIEVAVASKKAPAPESPDEMPPPVSDEPSIAVLPFTNISGEPEQAYFCDGITEEIITALSKIPGLFVIARNSVFVYKEKSINVQQVARELGVRYVLEGSVRKGGTRIRITAQLIDAVTGNHVWAERYDRELEDIFAVQDDIAKRIIIALQVELTDGEQARISGKGTDNLDAYLKTLQAREQFYRMNRQGSMRARELAEEAIQLDPGYASPYVISALTHMMDVWFKFTEHPEKSLKSAEMASQKALSLDSTDPGAHGGLCMLLVMQRKHDEAISAGRRAVTLSPSGASAHSALATALNYVGRHEEAIAFHKKAISLNPFPPSVYLRNLGTAYRMSGRHHKAVTEFKKTLNKNPDDLFAHLGLAICYVSLGRDEEARTEAAEVLRIHPEFSLSYFAETLPYKKQSEIDEAIASLRRTGLK